MRRQPDAGLQGDRGDFPQERAESSPEFLVGDRGDAALGRVRVIDHVPDHAVGHWSVQGAFHADGAGAASRIRGVGAAANSRDAEIVAQDGDASLAQAADDGFDVFQLLLLLWAIQKDVVPVGGVKVLDGLEFEAGGVDFFAQGQQFCQGPELVGIPGQAPALFRAGGLIIPGIVSAAFEVIHQMSDNVRGPGLPRELKVIAGKHMPIQTKAQFHFSQDKPEKPRQRFKKWERLLAGILAPRRRANQGRTARQEDCPCKSYYPPFRRRDRTDVRSD